MINVKIRRFKCSKMYKELSKYIRIMSDIYLKMNKLKKAYPEFFKIMFEEECKNSKDRGCELRLFTKWCGYKNTEFTFY